MNWDKFFKPIVDWEASFDAWVNSLPDRGGLIDCVQYNAEHGNLDGWADQVVVNRETQAKLKKEYAESHPVPHIGTVTFICD